VNIKTLVMGWQGIDLRILAYRSSEQNPDDYKEDVCFDFGVYKPKVIFEFEADPDDTSWPYTEFSLEKVRDELIREGYDMISVILQISHINMGWLIFKLSDGTVPVNLDTGGREQQYACKLNEIKILTYWISDHTAKEWY
jgi:hypothetical protein